MEMGMPFTPRSPRPRIREPVAVLATHQERQVGLLTIGHHGNTSIVNTVPVPEDLADVALVLDGDELEG